MQPTLAVAVLVLAGAGLAHGEAVEIEGTVCRCNRSVDRLILEVGGKRQRVAVERRGYIVLAPDHLTAGERIYRGKDSFDSGPFYEQYPVQPQSVVDNSTRSGI